MGIKGALSYGQLCQHLYGKFEEDFVYAHPTQPLLWKKKYIDDFFFIWTYTKESPNDFLNYLNNCDRNIKFSYEK